MSALAERRDLQADRPGEKVMMPFRLLRHPRSGEVSLAYKSKAVLDIEQEFTLSGAPVQPILRLMEMFAELERHCDIVTKERDDAVLQNVQAQEEARKEKQRREEVERRYGKTRKGGLGSEEK